MQWYLAKIVFRIICGDGNHSSQFDEQLRLISANNEDEAFYKAQSLGKQEEDSFLNVQQTAGAMAIHKCIRAYTSSQP